MVQGKIVIIITPSKNRLQLITRERILMPGLFFTASIKKMPMYTKVRFEQS